ncbi:hypothetical protein [Herbihabitans rhizosphaerae]|uniref:hypothetical protein n=1 Tax=Herbihabitans rhizosphaerae TaxID=1872711 RepID=UPI001F5F16B9|nr:hypothetical protein [Herbihabitans rhizosphaerae]
MTPEDAVSPMDAMNTVQIPRAVVAEADRDDPEMTMVVYPNRSGRERAKPPVPHARQNPEPVAPVDVPAAPQAGDPDPTTGPLPIISELEIPDVTQSINPPPRPAHKPHTQYMKPPPRPQEPVQAEESEQPPSALGGEAPTEGLIPTIKQQVTGRRSLSQRLDGK